eukprot:COSAG02_NODE_4_length_69935_cov_46.806590_30_plen_71_part_00
MKVTSGDVSDWEDEWQALHLFSAFAFRKVRDNAGGGGGDSAGGASAAADESATAKSDERKPFDLSQITRL